MPNKNYKQSEKHRLNRIKSLRGRKLSEEHKKKIGKSIKGITAWNKGLKGIYKLSEETKKKMSKAKIGKKPYEMTDEIRKKQSESHSKEKSHFWQGGKSFEKYGFDWTETLRRSIRERDNYICQLCNKNQIEELEQFERKLSIHHKDFNKQNNNPNNLISLCHQCHMKTNNNRKDWKDFFKASR